MTAKEIAIELLRTRKEGLAQIRGHFCRTLTGKDHTVLGAIHHYLFNNGALYNRLFKMRTGFHCYKKIPTEPLEKKILNNQLVVIAYWIIRFALIAAKIIPRKKIGPMQKVTVIE